MTDSLKLAVENKYLTYRYADILHPKEEESRTSDEIISNIVDKLKGVGT